MEYGPEGDVCFLKRGLVTFLTMILALAFLLTACGNTSGGTSPSQTESGISDGEEEKEDVELSLWTYPVGGWGNSGTISSLLAAFHRDNPNIRITVKLLSYDTGDAEIEEAIQNGDAPDLVLEGPERVVANWGVRGLMADLKDLWETDHAGEIYESVKEACHDAVGSYYIYPVCMTTHCMAINKDLFEAAGAWRYIDEETHTWSTDDFIAAVEALNAYGVEDIASIYCKGQGGDQGTRALVNNLYSGTFTDPDHNRYTVNSSENIKALELLRGMEGISFDSDLVGADEVERFCDGKLAMAFCWNVFMEVNQTVSNPNLNFDIFPMAFPTNDGEVNLQGGIWGFGIFDHGNDARTQAAKTFIRFMTETDSQYTRAVLASTYWPVRDMPGIYANDQLMNEYSIFQQYLGDYYQVTPGWAEARTAWWNMLQRVGAGEDVSQAVKEFEEDANAAAVQGS